MLTDFSKQCKTAFLLCITLSILTGILYPSVITVLAQYFFPWQANGSMIQKNGMLQGSALIGQAFTDPRYFWGRPSATPTIPYNAASSAGSNLGPTNPALINTIKMRILALKQVDPTNTAPIPVELVTASGSGLDPDISPNTAYYQIPRIARQRHLPDAMIRQLIDKTIIPRTFGLFGEPRIPVLQLNMQLDTLTMETHHAKFTSHT